jgi:hypothetical protein
MLSAAKGLVAQSLLVGTEATGTCAEPTPITYWSGILAIVTRMDRRSVSFLDHLHAGAGG